MDTAHPPSPRPLYRALALAALGAGCVGALVPLLPTTPFVLIALWAAGRGSPALQARIRSHPRFGPIVRAWEDERAVPGAAKWVATAAMAASWAVLWLLGAPTVILAAIGLGFCALAAFLAARPRPTSEAMQ